MIYNSTKNWILNCLFDRIFDSISCMFLATPYGQLPMLVTDKGKVGQSTAICRYLAKQYGLAGKNDWEALLIDATVDTIHDVRYSEYQCCFA